MSGKPWEVLVGDVRRVLRGLDPAWFDACLSDPPYGLSFMGNRWDYSVPSVNVWVELLRVLKPGAYAMLFGGTRTFHRLMVAVEDAGFLPCDTCMWMHGKGFPKSLNISVAIDKRLGAKRTKVVGHKDAGLDRGSGASVDFQGSRGRDETGLIPITVAATPQAARWEGYGTALKPAWEPIMLACKPQDGTYAENALRHGCGALAIDASRIGVTGGTAGHSYEKTGLFGMGGKAVIEQIPAGRYPANVLLDEEAAEMLDAQSGDRPSTLTGRADPSKAHSHPAEPTRTRGSMFGNAKAGGVVYADGGGASRFYYVTKASRAERDRGLEGTAVAEGPDTQALRDGSRHPARVHNIHPTVKPIDLCRYFARLLLPPPREDGKPRRIVVPFSGSGSEMMGCLQAGWDEVVGIELDPKHAETARARIARGKIVQHAASKRG